METHLQYITDGKPHPDELYEMIRIYAEKNGLSQTLSALPYGRKKHEGQFRAGRGHVEYYYHPMSACAHAISLGITEDDILAAALLHDVCEDCGVSPEELPVGKTVQDAVASLTRDSKIGWTEEGKDLYYRQIRTNRIGLLVKLLDRCDNVSTMSAGFTPARIAAYARDTRHWVYPLFEPTSEFWPEYRLQVFMIRRQIDAVLWTIEDLTE